MCPPTWNKFSDSFPGRGKEAFVGAASVYKEKRRGSLSSSPTSKLVVKTKTPGSKSRNCGMEKEEGEEASLLLNRFQSTAPSHQFYNLCQSQALICGCMILNSLECVRWSILSTIVLHDPNSPNFGCWWDPSFWFEKPVYWTEKIGFRFCSLGLGWDTLQITRIPGIIFLPRDFTSISCTRPVSTI